MRGDRHPHEVEQKSLYKGQEGPTIHGTGAASVSSARGQQSKRESDTDGQSKGMWVGHLEIYTQMISEDFGSSPTSGVQGQAHIHTNPTVLAGLHNTSW